MSSSSSSESPSSRFPYSGPIPKLAAGLLGLGLLYQFSPFLRAHTSPSITPGKVILSTVALFTSTSTYLADWSETHVFNPRWPPHAKFHNGQTMSTGLALGLLTAYFTWRPKESTLIASKDIFTAGILGSLYWVTALSGALYPGTKFTDPEFVESHGDYKQAFLFPVVAAVTGLGCWLEMRRLAGLQLP